MSRFGRPSADQCAPPLPAGVRCYQNTKAPEVRSSRCLFRRTECGRSLNRHARLILPELSHSATLGLQGQSAIADTSVGDSVPCLSWPVQWTGPSVGGESKLRYDTVEPSGRGRFHRVVPSGCISVARQRGHIQLRGESSNWPRRVAGVPGRTAHAQLNKVAYCSLCSPCAILHCNCTGQYG